MVVQLFLLAYAVAVGFVAAGILTSLWQLLTAKPPQLSVPSGSVPAVTAAIAFAAVAGPIVVLRIATEKGHTDGPGRVAIGLAISVLWSCCLGLLLLEFILAMARLV